MYKKLLAVGVAAALSMTAVSAMAGQAPSGLTLASSGAPHQIVVTCNGVPGLKMIPATGSLPAFSFGAIWLMFHSGNNLSCTFTLHGTGALIGTANLTLTGFSGQTGEISNISNLAPGYSVSVLPGTGAMHHGLLVGVRYS